MHERILELIIYLINEIRDEKHTDYTAAHDGTRPIAGVRQYQKSSIDINFLTKSGYTPAEISTAFSWLFDHITLGDDLIVGVNSSHSHRIFHEVERLAIGSEAQGYLIQLRELGLITNDDVEVVIGRVMMSGLSQAGIAEIKSLVAAILFENDESTRLANRVVLNSTDTIH